MKTAMLAVALFWISASCHGQAPDPELVELFRVQQKEGVESVDARIAALRKSTGAGIDKAISEAKARTARYRAARIDRRVPFGTVPGSLDGLPALMPSGADIPSGERAADDAFRTLTEKSKTIRGSVAVEARLTKCKAAYAEKGLEGFSVKDAELVNGRNGGDIMPGSDALWSAMASESPFFAGSRETLRELLDLRGRYSDGTFRFPPLFGSRLRTGAIGSIEAARVAQVIDEQTMLAKIEGSRNPAEDETMVWIECDTADITDDSLVYPEDCYYCYGTKTYTSVSGGSRTVFALRPIDLEPIRKAAMIKPTIKIPDAP